MFAYEYSVMSIPHTAVYCMEFLLGCMSKPHYCIALLLVFGFRSQFSWSNIPWRIM